MFGAVVDNLADCMEIPDRIGAPVTAREQRYVKPRGVGGSRARWLASKGHRGDGRDSAQAHDAANRDPQAPVHGPTPDAKVTPPPSLPKRLLAGCLARPTLRIITDRLHKVKRLLCHYRCTALLTV